MDCVWWLKATALGANRRRKEEARRWRQARTRLSTGRTQRWEKIVMMGSDKWPSEEKKKTAERLWIAARRRKKKTMGWRNESEYELSVREPRETNQTKEFLIGIVYFVSAGPRHSDCQCAPGAHFRLWRKNGSEILINSLMQTHFECMKFAIKVILSGSKEVIERRCDIGGVNTGSLLRDCEPTNQNALAWASGRRLFLRLRASSKEAECDWK